MAKETGWDHFYICKTFTLSQIRWYYIKIYEQKKAENVKLFEGMFHAVAAAQGHLKPGDFKDYLETYLGKKYGEQEDVVQKLKKEGIEVEDN